ncbi:ATP F0F1 synthase subunit I [Mesorhizobium sp. SEMIA 3007]|uniref:ATP synthase protein I n=1 Tax=Mesorhizobium jarvisii TaxID=1777867 RepID=A0A6M7TLF1_9HYPH|nr:MULTISPECIES: AtpZ/AtpI family protein [Mesorhizobium]OBQ68889.1 ATP F0F1 synthase subunit I [Mesorhizobium loti]ODA94112.1 ATP F0F1 synthase subunit I [Mesorhizobium sp. SEMIA 3007]QKC65854.1 ATP F0F1 synthase subunit I [Mesorhizobium jarvisii]QKD11768.1 ATP F0F1 synthase subunit I [Mesorhizobium loti]RJT37874.1 ATP F0F1 synthase subunit I [Mesorhizobium jarvisii]
MADKNGPDGTGETGRGKQHETGIRDDDLERRRRELEASLATRRPNRLEGKDDAKAGSAAGYGQAVKLSSEFIAGVVVGAGIGWIIDRMAGTSPWGLIVFLLLGFGAGVLNVMRSAGVVAEFGQGDKSRSGRDDSK